MKVFMNKGKTLMSYCLERLYTYAYYYCDNSFNYPYLCNLIKKINDGRSVYHFSHMNLYKYISSRIEFLRMCHYATFLLKTCRCYGDVRRIILSFLIILCNETKNDMLMLCL